MSIDDVQEVTDPGHSPGPLVYNKALQKFEYAKTEAPKNGPRIGLRWNRKENTTSIGLLPPSGETAKAHPCVALEILDKEIAHDLDPLLLDTIVPLWHTLDGPTVIRVENRDALRLTPMPDGTQPSMNLSRDVFDAILVHLGSEDTGATAPEWLEQALAAARDVMREAPPAGGLAGLKGELSVRQLQAWDVGRWYGAPPEALAAALGRTCSGKLLLKPGGKAFAMSLAKAGEEAEAARIAEEARVREEIAKTPNAKSMAALGLVGLAVPNDGFAQLPPGLTYRLPVQFEGQQDRMPVLFPIHTDRSGTDYYVWPAIEGLPLPSSGSIAGCSVIAPDAVLPVAPAPRLAASAEQPPVDALYHFTISLRRRFLPDLDRGPVQEWSKEGHARARAIATKYAPLFRRQRDPLRRWQLAHGIALAVRGLKVSPIRVIALWMDAIADCKVDAGDGVRQELESMALDAAQGGEVGVGSLLNSKETSKKKNVKEG